MVENIISALRCKNSSKQKLLESLDILHDYLLQIINKETKDYVAFVDYHFPTEKISLLEKIKHILLD